MNGTVLALVTLVLLAVASGFFLLEELEENIKRERSDIKSDKRY
ncbi:hypothetical protein [Thomasclavelia cocleata]|nr:hypothetical protein [Thomasclavelia cocleata]